MNLRNPYRQQPQPPNPNNLAGGGAPGNFGGAPNVGGAGPGLAGGAGPGPAGGAQPGHVGGAAPGHAAGARGRNPRNGHGISGLFGTIIQKQYRAQNRQKRLSEDYINAYRVNKLGGRYYAPSHSDELPTSNQPKRTMAPALRAPDKSSKMTPNLLPDPRLRFVWPRYETPNNYISDIPSALQDASDYTTIREPEYFPLEDPVQLLHYTQAYVEKIQGRSRYAIAAARNETPRPSRTFHVDRKKYFLWRNDFNEWESGPNKTPQHIRAPLLDLMGRHVHDFNELVHAQMKENCLSFPALFRTEAANEVKAQITKIHGPEYAALLHSAYIRMTTICCSLTTVMNIITHDQLTDWGERSDLTIQVRQEKSHEQRCILITYKWIIVTLRKIMSLMAKEFRSDSTPTTQFEALLKLRNDFPCNAEWRAILSEDDPEEGFRNAPWSAGYRQQTKSSLLQQAAKSSFSEAEYCDLALAFAKANGTEGLPSRFRDKLRDKIKSPKQKERIQQILSNKRKRSDNTPSKN